MQMTDCVALVTAGGGYGIGKAVCMELAAHGATVAVTDRNGDRAGKVAEGIRNLGNSARSWQLDVTSHENVNEVFADVARSLGKIDILVNNAGVSIPAPVADMSDELFDRVVNISLRGTFLCSRAVLPDMMERQFGRIVNVSSYVAYAGSAGLAHYAAAKAGVAAFTKSLALEVGSHGITVNAVAPGIILNEHLRRNQDQFSEDIREKLEKGTAVGRHGEPEDVARSILFLASPANSFTTGVTLPVNGGLFMN